MVELLVLLMGMSKLHIWLVDLAVVMPSWEVEMQGVAVAPLGLMFRAPFQWRQIPPFL